MNIHSHTFRHCLGWLVVVSWFWFLLLFLRWLVWFVGWLVRWRYVLVWMKTTTTSTERQRNNKAGEINRKWENLKKRTTKNILYEMNGKFLHFVFFFYFQKKKYIHAFNGSSCSFTCFSFCYFIATLAAIKYFFISFCSWYCCWPKYFIRFISSGC